MSTGNNLSALRASLFETLRGVRDGSIDLDRARTVNDVARTLIDSAKVEVDFLRHVGDVESDFLGSHGTSTQSAQPGNGKLLGTRTHRLLG